VASRDPVTLVPAAKLMLLAMVFSPDGTRLVAVARAFSPKEPATLAVYDTATAQRVAVLETRSPMEMLTFSSGGRYLGAYGSQEGTVEIWDMAVAVRAASYGVGRGVLAIQLSTDGKQLQLARRGMLETRLAATGAVLWQAELAAPRPTAGAGEVGFSG